jgi:hypothetical protein
MEVITVSAQKISLTEIWIAVQNWRKLLILLTITMGLRLAM